MPPYERDGFTISTDPDWLDLAFVHDFLTQSYWAKGVSFETIQQAAAHSLCFGVYEGAAQVGFARVITDYTTMAYLADVFIAAPYRGRGLAKWLIGCILAHPDLQTLRRWMLATADAHGLYAPFGFAAVEDPARFMIRGAALSEAN